MDPDEDFVQPDLDDGTPIDNEAEPLDAAPTHEHGDAGFVAEMEGELPW